MDEVEFSLEWTGRTGCFYRDASGDYYVDGELLAGEQYDQVISTFAIARIELSGKRVAVGPEKRAEILRAIARYAELHGLRIQYE